MKSLKKLEISWNSGIDQLGINELDLIKFNVCNNPQINM